MSDIVKGSFSQIEKMFDKPGMVTGLETGFTDLDRLTSGFQPSDLIIIAGRPSMGKTSFALDIADRILVLEKGEIVAEETRANVNEEKIAAYLSV